MSVCICEYLDGSHSDRAFDHLGARGRTPLITPYIRVINEKRIEIKKGTGDTLRKLRTL